MYFLISKSLLLYFSCKNNQKNLRGQLLIQVYLVENIT